MLIVLLLNSSVSLSENDMFLMRSQIKKKKKHVICDTLDAICVISQDFIRNQAVTIYNYLTESTKSHI